MLRSIRLSRLKRGHGPWKVFVVAALLGGLAFTSRAEAGLLPVQVTTQPDSGNTRFTYSIVLTSDSLLEPGDFFTIYDFAGYVDNSNVDPSGFSFSTAMVGQTPTGTVPTDDPSLVNLTWTYNGPTVLAGQVGLGNYSVISIYEESRPGEFTARTHRQVDGLVDSNITEASIPVKRLDDPPPVVPEPASLILVGLGLPLIGAARLARRRK